MLVCFSTRRSRLKFAELNIARTESCPSTIHDDDVVVVVVVDDLVYLDKSAPPDNLGYHRWQLMGNIK